MNYFVHNKKNNYINNNIIVFMNFNALNFSFSNTTIFNIRSFYFAPFVNKI